MLWSERRHHAELAAAQADVTLHRAAERGVSQQRGTMAGQISIVGGLKGCRF